MDRPNVLYINSHDTGRYIQPYGYPVPTPKLQRFAEQGTLFRQCFCSGPTCSPSRAAMLTGQAAHSSGMFGLSHMDWKLNDYKQHWVHTLHGAGYRSYYCGGQHITKDVSVIGYHEWTAPGNQEERCDKAVEFLHGKPAQPFYLEVGFESTHRGFPKPGKDDDARYVRPPAILPDTPETRYDFASFITSARKLDELMGRVFDALDESGLAENTLVICTTDHGIAFPGMKCNLTDHGTGVMLMMRGPGGFNDGKVIDGMVSHIDIFPTLCDVLELDPPEWLQGKSMLPLVCGEDDEINDAVFSEVSYHAAYEPMRSIRTQRWKYIRRIGGQRRLVIPNCDGSPSKDVWMRHGWDKTNHPDEELYDLVFDPMERRNLATMPEMAGIVKELGERLEEWMEETNDPLIETGWVEPHVGVASMDPNLRIDPCKATLNLWKYSPAGD